ncbi:ROK family protein [Celeribacter sp.]|uniref:ROK family transcriptional regulator n=1 Tax=Celeribacter sp. TaxID=1890673 RepID=UPI003A8D4617
MNSADFKSTIAEGENQGCGPLFRAQNATPKPLKRQLLEAIRAAGTIARVDIAKHLDISPATVTTLATDLIDMGLIAETEIARSSSDSTRGRPRVGLKINGAAAAVIGIKISDRGNSAVLLDLAGKRIGATTLPAPPEQRSTEEIIEEIENLVVATLASAGLDRSHLATVALGIPGMVDFDAGQVIWCPFLTEPDIPLRDMLQQRLGIPVRIDNDANLLAMAELWFGAGRALDNFAVVSIEHGVGIGYVQGHTLQRGGAGHGMELGHMTIQINGALCRCGKRGCLEAYVADYALVREAHTALAHPFASTTSPTEMLEDLFGRAKDGNEAARAIFSRAGRYLAVGLANVVTMFDPALILLSGDRLRYDYLYAEEVLSEYRDLTQKPGRPSTPVDIHAWGDLIWAQGAGALALDHATERLLG